MLIMVEHLNNGTLFGDKIHQQVNSLFSVGSSGEVRAGKVAIAHCMLPSFKNAGHTSFILMMSQHFLTLTNTYKDMLTSFKSNTKTHLMIDLMRLV
jgi:TRAP-type mannitol/chloroaromatic compound transport system substrate-binding protein